MKLTTNVEIAKPGFEINYRGRGLVLGSCFAQNIGLMMEQSLMSVRVNPYGVIYNPLSVVKALEKGETKKDELVCYNGLWHSMLHHGSFSCPTAEETMLRVNEYVHSTEADRYDYVIVTLGTAWIYRMNGEVVANCHKIPGGEFTRERLSLEQTVAALERMMELCPGARFIFTVSPIRHLKDGLVENSVSKATLRLALEQVVAASGGRAAYFPAYEIMIDELRDYRFYNQDMTHPSPLAVEYILDRFCQTFMDVQTQNLIVRAAKIRKAREHRPLHPQSDQYAKFMEYINREMVSLMADFPNLSGNF